MDFEQEYNKCGLSKKVDNKGYVLPPNENKEYTDCLFKVLHSVTEFQDKVQLTINASVREYQKDLLKKIFMNNLLLN